MKNWLIPAHFSLFCAPIVGGSWFFRDLATAAGCCDGLPAIIAAVSVYERTAFSFFGETSLLIPFPIGLVACHVAFAARSMDFTPFPIGCMAVCGARNYNSGGRQSLPFPENRGVQKLRLRCPVPLRPQRGLRFRRRTRPLQTCGGLPARASGFCRRCRVRRDGRARALRLSIFRVQTHSVRVLRDGEIAAFVA